MFILNTVEIDFTITPDTPVPMSGFIKKEYMVPFKKLELTLT